MRSGVVETQPQEIEWNTCEDDEGCFTHPIPDVSEAIMKKQKYTQNITNVLREINIM